MNFEHLRDGDAITQEEGGLLYAIVRATKPDYCFETGTHKGLSTHYIAQALKDNSKGHVETCDPIDWGQHKIFEDSTLREYMTFIPKRGIDVPVYKKIDFLFIDGYHGKKDVVEEIDYFFPHLSDNAIVMFHDCDDEPICNTEGVNAAIKEKGLNTVYIKTKNRMRILEKSGI